MTTLNAQTSFVMVNDLPSLMERTDQGVISLIGSNDNEALITGDVKRTTLSAGSIAIPMVSVETEFGFLYLDPDDTQHIIERW